MLNHQSIRKVLVLLPILLIGLTSLFAQEAQKSSEKRNHTVTKFRKGDIEFKAGIGILPTFIDKKSKVVTPPVQATIGYRINPNFSVNAFAGYSSTIGAIDAKPDGSSYQSKNDFLVVGLRLEGHMTRIENVDIYGGLTLAYNKPFVTHTQLTFPQHPINDAGTPSPTPFNPNVKNNNVIAGGFVGGSWYFAKNIAVFGEVGYGVSIATVGLGYKF